MAQRRMFSKGITNTSRFLMMPVSAQNLYFHLGMNADDDGFCEHFPIMRMVEAKPDDLKVLQARGLVHVFDDKVLIVADWKENNYIQKDRYTPSKYLEIYQQELQELAQNKHNLALPVNSIHSVYKMDTQVRLGKVRKDSDLLCKSASASEDWSTEQTDEEGNVVGGKSNKPRVQKNGGAMRVVQYFAERALAYIGQPVVSNGYGHVKRLMEGKGKCTEEFLKKVIDDFFEESPTNERAGNIFVCLSARNINRMIAESHG